VSTLGGLSLWDATNLAFTDSSKFAEILISSHAIVSGFGGAFLMMIFLKYFIDAEREEHWLPGVETVLGKLGHVEEIQILITLLFAGIVAYISGSIPFFLAAVAGVTGHIVIDLIKAGLEAIDHKMSDKAAVAGSMATGGLGMFLYLEIFDASMSFDGVIAAFAITNKIEIVAVGLGVGAVFVRSLTLMFYDTKSLATYRYLEPGAFWAIGGLSIFMFLSVIEHIPDWIISGYGGLVIIIAFIHSILANRKDASDPGIGLSKAVDDNFTSGVQYDDKGQLIVKDWVKDNGTLTMDPVKVTG